jgi:hypothetical protein
MKKTIASFAVAAIMAVGSTSSFATALIDQASGVSNANVSMGCGFASGSTIAGNLADVSRCEYTSINQCGSHLQFTNHVSENACAVNGVASSGTVWGNALTAGQSQAMQSIGIGSSN